MSLVSSSIFNESIPIEAIDYVSSHINYTRYLKYLKTWKEELNEDSYDRACRISKMFNFGMVGNGDRRVCCYYEDYIIKFPLESCHYESNENEVHLFNYIKENHPSHLNYLCPIKEFKEGLIVVPYCDELDITDEEFYALCDDIKLKFKLLGIKFTDLDAPHQFGVLDGNIVILDYEDYEFI